MFQRMTDMLTTTIVNQVSPAKPESDVQAVDEAKRAHDVNNEQVSSTARVMLNESVTSRLAQGMEELHEIEELIETHSTFVLMHQNEIKDTISDELSESILETIEAIKELSVQVDVANEAAENLEQYLIRLSAGLNRDEEIQRISAVNERIQRKFQTLKDQIDQLIEKIDAVEAKSQVDIISEAGWSTPTLSIDETTDSDGSEAENNVVDAANQAVTFAPVSNEPAVTQVHAESSRVEDNCVPYQVDDDEFGDVTITAEDFIVQDPFIPQQVKKIQALNRGAEEGSAVQVPAPARVSTPSIDQMVEKLASQYDNQLSETKCYLAKLRYYLENDRNADLKRMINSAYSSDFKILGDRKRLEDKVYALICEDFQATLETLAANQVAQNGNNKKYFDKTKKQGKEVIDFYEETKSDRLRPEGRTDRLKFIEAVECSRNLVNSALDGQFQEKYKEFNKYSTALRLDPNPEKQKLGQRLQAFGSVLLVAVGIAALCTPVGWVGLGIAAGAVLFACVGKALQENSYHAAKKPMRELSDAVYDLNHVVAKKS